MFCGWARGKGRWAIGLRTMPVEEGSRSLRLWRSLSPIEAAAATATSTAVVGKEVVVPAADVGR